MPRTSTNYARQTAPIPAPAPPTRQQVAAELRATAARALALAQRLDPQPQTRNPKSLPPQRRGYLTKPPQQQRLTPVVTLSHCGCCTHGNCPCPCHRGPS